MTPKAVETLIGTVCSIEGLPENPRAIQAKGSDSRMYYAKSALCRKITRNPTWLVNELFFYSVAKDSQLEMPYCAIIKVGDELYWGSEYVKGRNALRKKEADSGPEIRRICETSKGQLMALTRALLLDIALLNSDRKPWNMLVSGVGDARILHFFDHDKSLLGDGREPGEHPPGDLGRIANDAIVDVKVRDYLACPAANSAVLDLVCNADFRMVFNSLALNSDSLDRAKLSCPEAWLNEELYSRLKTFLLNWWEFLRHKFLETTPLAYFSKILSNP